MHLRWNYSNSLRSERVLLLATCLFTYCEDAFLAGNLANSRESVANDDFGD